MIHGHHRGEAIRPPVTRVGGPKACRKKLALMAPFYQLGLEFAREGGREGPLLERTVTESGRCPVTRNCLKRHARETLARGGKLFCW